MEFIICNNSNGEEILVNLRFVKTIKKEPKYFTIFDGVNVFKRENIEVIDIKEQKDENV
jgi:predicted peroxiredoxin